MDQQDQQNNETIENVINSVEKAEDILTDEGDQDQQDQQEQSQSQDHGSGSFLDALFEKNNTPLNQYDNHPLNILENDGNKMVIRGVEGVIGNAHCNITDILVGTAKIGFDWYKSQS